MSSSLSNEDKALLKGRVSVKGFPIRQQDFQIPRAGEDSARLALVKKKRGVFVCANTEEALRDDEPSVAIGTCRPLYHLNVKG